jgi:hypothetical protein
MKLLRGDLWPNMGSGYICKKECLVFSTFLKFKLWWKRICPGDWNKDLLMTDLSFISRLTFSILTTKKSLPPIYYNQHNGAVAHNLTVRVCLQISHIDLLVTKITPNPWTPFVKTYKTINATKHLFLPIFFQPTVLSSDGEIFVDNAKCMKNTWTSSKTCIY